MQICQNQCIFHAPPAHLLPQYCTLLGKTRPRHRPHSGTAGTASSPRRICCPSTAPCLAKPGTGIAPAPVADCRLCHLGLCRPGAASSHRLPAPSGTASSHRLPTPSGAAGSHRLPTPPGTTRALAPASHLQTAKRRAHRNGRRGVNTQRGVSARRLTRQLRKSPRPQRRHLRCRLLARPLRERQRPQEQQR